MSSYIVKSFDLAAATDAPTLIAETRGKAVAQVQVLDCTTGAQFFVRIGENNPRIIVAVNRNFTLPPDAPEERGIFYENPVAAVGNVTLLISFSEECAGGMEVGPS